MRALSERPARHNTLDDCRCCDLAPAGIIRVGNGSEDPEVDRYVVVLSHRQFVEIVAMDDEGDVVLRDERRIHLRRATRNHDVNVAARLYPPVALREVNTGWRL